VLGWLILFPLALIALTALAASVSVRRSTLRISVDGVEVRNYPQPVRVVPLGSVDHFADAERVGFLASLRPATAVLVLTDGSRVPVRSLREPEAGYGIDALNERLARVRAS
jgi:hypothetical protein